MFAASATLSTSGRAEQYWIRGCNWICSCFHARWSKTDVKRRRATVVPPPAPSSARDQSSRMLLSLIFQSDILAFVLRSSADRRFLFVTQWLGRVSDADTVDLCERTRRWSESNRKFYSFLCYSTFCPLFLIGISKWVRSFVFLILYRNPQRRNLEILRAIAFREVHRFMSKRHRRKKCAKRDSISWRSFLSLSRQNSRRFIGKWGIHTYIARWFIRIGMRGLRLSVVSIECTLQRRSE